MAPPSFDQTYAYDALGNLISKAGVNQQYGANLNGTGAQPHAVRAVAGQSYTYDANGNLSSGGGRTLSWNAVNLPSQVAVTGSVTETYQYDADGNRAARTVNPGNLTTVYALGVYEVEGATTRKLYRMGAEVIAVRDSGLGLSYLYGDQIGSVSASTNSAGVVTGMQHFDPWGTRLNGSMPATDRNFTGQYLDDTGLLFSNARYYDPGSGRFISADTVVPGNASGGMAGIALKPLTVAFHETPFLTKLNAENQFGPWYTLSDRQRQQLGSPWGSANPQALNRYSYVLNNPMRYTDSSGHALHIPYSEAAATLKLVLTILKELRNTRAMENGVVAIGVTAMVGVPIASLSTVVGYLAGLGVTVATTFLSADTVRLDINGTLDQLEALEWLAAALLDFMKNGSPHDVMTVWASSLQQRDPGCEADRFLCLTYQSYQLSYGWADYTGEPHAISRSTFERFVAQTEGHTQGSGPK